ncbi:MAG: endonuclease V [Actinomycetota bacterium]
MCREPATGWPSTTAELLEAQRSLADATPSLWTPPDGAMTIGGVWFCAPSASPGDRAGERAWAAAVVGTRAIVVRGRAGAGYAAGFLAMREGPLLEAAMRALPSAPDVLLVNATGRDHPWRAGLALHLGAVLDTPTVGVTHRPLLASGTEPAPERWAVSDLVLDASVVAAWLRTRSGVRPVVVHPGWRTDLGTALEVVRRDVGSARTPESLRHARHSARLARAIDEGAVG